MGSLQQIYDSFLVAFPEPLRPYISLAVGVCLVVAIVQVLRKEFIWLIVLIILLPESVPILKGVATTLLAFLQYLFGAHTEI